MYHRDSRTTALLIIIITSLGHIMAIETPDYHLISKSGDFEIREYAPMVIARTEVKSAYKEATYTGFRRIANYIFGGNDKQLNITMTAPVISNRLEKNHELYEVIFVMPKQHTLKSLPEPDLSNVYLEERKFGKVVSVSFGGWATKNRANHYKQILQNYMKSQSIDRIGDFMIAQYNSPWVIPPFRKNEIMVRIKE
tara:strand:+ start:1581 stop:2168 length:588 start_codon:yes stop_codon:yes gene_type:complete